MILPVVGGTLVVVRGVEVATAGVDEGVAGVDDGCKGVMKGLSVVNGIQCWFCQEWKGYWWLEGDLRWLEGELRWLWQVLSLALLLW